MRLVTYVDPATADIYRETADAMGQTVSAWLADVLAYSLPVVEVLRDTAIAMRDYPDRVAEHMEAYAAQLRPMAADVLRDIDSPPPSNRGGTT